MGHGMQRVVEYRAQQTTQGAHEDTQRCPFQKYAEKLTGLTHMIHPGHGSISSFFEFVRILP